MAAATLKQQPAQPKKVRVIRLIVKPEVVVDDGVHLTPLDIEPVAVAPADFAKFATEGLAISLATLEEQVNGQPAEAVNEAEAVPPAAPSNPAATRVPRTGGKRR